jgi:cytochrome c biogenesis protein CcmG/thiol:disulfide interchange protein DsbE
MTGPFRTARVAALALAVAAACTKAPKVLTAGSPAPDFRAVTLETPPQPRSLADYRGHVVLLNLWATYCEPCKVEMPSMEALYREFGPAGLRVVAVAVDDPGLEPQVRDFVRRLDLTFDILSEGSGAIERDYQARGIPASYLIGPDGIIRKRIAGASDWSSPANRALVAQLLGIPLPNGS